MSDEQFVEFLRKRGLSEEDCETVKSESYYKNYTLEMNNLSVVINQEME